MKKYRYKISLWKNPAMNSTIDIAIKSCYEISLEDLAMKSRYEIALYIVSICTCYKVTRYLPASPFRQLVSAIFLLICVSQYPFTSLVASGASPDLGKEGSWSDRLLAEPAWHWATRVPNAICQKTGMKLKTSPVPICFGLLVAHFITNSVEMELKRSVLECGRTFAPARLHQLFSSNFHMFVSSIFSGSLSH